MQRTTTTWLAACMAIAALSSCSPSLYSDNGDEAYYRKLAHASRQLGLEISRKDDHALFITAASWLGTPYRYGGHTRQGIDCSGLARALMQEAYGIDLPPSSRGQLEACKHKVKERNLQGGDLLFFGPKGKKRNINHVGIYLKDRHFIHASNRGVMVSSLDEEYYARTYVCAARP